MAGGGKKAANREERGGAERGHTKTKCRSRRRPRCTRGWGPAPLPDARQPLPRGSAPGSENHPGGRGAEGHPCQPRSARNPLLFLGAGLGRHLRGACAAKDEAPGGGAARALQGGVGSPGLWVAAWVTSPMLACATTWPVLPTSLLAARALGGGLSRPVREDGSFVSGCPHHAPRPSPTQEVGSKRRCHHCTSAPCLVCRSVTKHVPLAVHFSCVLSPAPSLLLSFHSSTQ